MTLKEKLNQVWNKFENIWNKLTSVWKLPKIIFSIWIAFIIVKYLFYNSIFIYNNSVLFQIVQFTSLLALVIYFIWQKLINMINNV